MINRPIFTSNYAPGRKNDFLRTLDETTLSPNETYQDRLRSAAKILGGIPSSNNDIEKLDRALFMEEAQGYWISKCIEHMDERKKQSEQIRGSISDLREYLDKLK